MIRSRRNYLDYKTLACPLLLRLWLHLQAQLLRLLLCPLLLLFHLLLLFRSNFEIGDIDTPSLGERL